MTRPAVRVSAPGGARSAGHKSPERSERAFRNACGTALGRQGDGTAGRLGAAVVHAFSERFDPFNDRLPPGLAVDACSRSIEAKKIGGALAALFGSASRGHRRHGETWSAWTGSQGPVGGGFITNIPGNCAVVPHAALRNFHPRILFGRRVSTSAGFDQSAPTPGCSRSHRDAHQSPQHRRPFRAAPPGAVRGARRAALVAASRPWRGPFAHRVTLPQLNVRPGRLLE
jgi:hypothetical protein